MLYNIEPMPGSVCPLEKGCSLQPISQTLPLHVERLHCVLSEQHLPTIFFYFSGVLI